MTKKSEIGKALNRDETSFPITNNSSPVIQRSSSSTGHLYNSSKVIEVNKMIEDLRSLLPTNKINIGLESSGNQAASSQLDL